MLTKKECHLFHSMEFEIWQFAIERVSEGWNCTMAFPPMERRLRGSAGLFGKTVQTKTELIHAGAKGREIKEKG